MRVSIFLRRVLEMDEIWQASVSEFFTDVEHGAWGVHDYRSDGD